jgi:hypothetical protein
MASGLNSRNIFDDKNSKKRRKVCACATYYSSMENMSYKYVKAAHERVFSKEEYDAGRNDLLLAYNSLAAVCPSKPHATIYSNFFTTVENAYNMFGQAQKSLQEAKGIDVNNPQTTTSDIVQR